MAETLDVVDLLPSKFEPLRKFRWIMQIEGIDAFLLKTCTLPTSTFETTTIDWINSKRFLAGKHTFGTFTCTLHSAIAPSAAQQVMEWVRLNFEAVSGRSGYADFYKRDLQFKALDPIGTVVSLYDAKGCWITEFNPGDFDFASSDAVELSITIQPDIFVLQF